jgi:hypothetical protein
VTARRHRVFLWTGPLLILSWLSLAVLDPDPGGGLIETLGLGYFFGSLFGQATLAAAWSAWGPGRVVWRIPLSLIWVVSLAVAIGINVELNGGPNEAPIVLGGCLLGQWLLLQIPFWGLAVGVGLQLIDADEGAETFDPRHWQFGIRELIIITALVSVVLGVGRLVVPIAFNDSSREIPIFVFLMLAAIVLTLPLLLAALMRRMAVRGVLLALALIGAASLIELPLLRSFHRGPGPQALDFVAINAFTAAMILAVASVVRLNGLCLGKVEPGLATVKP